MVQTVLIIKHSSATAEMETGKAVDELVSLFSGIYRLSRIAAVLNNPVGFLLPSNQSLKAWFYTKKRKIFSFAGLPGYSRRGERGWGKGRGGDREQKAPSLSLLFRFPDFPTCHSPTPRFKSLGFL